MTRFYFAVRWNEVETSNMVSEVAKVMLTSGEKLPLGTAAVRAQQSLHLQGRLSYDRVKSDEACKMWARSEKVKAAVNAEISHQIKSGATKPAPGFEYQEDRSKMIQLGKALEKAEAMNLEQALMIEQLSKTVATANTLLLNLQQLALGQSATGVETPVEHQPEQKAERKHRVLVVGPLASQQQTLLNHCPENISLDFVASSDPQKRTRAKVNGGRIEGVLVMVDFASVGHKTEAKRHNNMIPISGGVKNVVERLEVLSKEFGLN